MKLGLGAAWSLAEGLCAHHRANGADDHRLELNSAGETAVVSVEIARIMAQRGDAGSDFELAPCQV